MSATLQANPYRDGATRDLHAFPSVRQAYAYAHKQLELRGEAGENKTQRSEE